MRNRRLSPSLLSSTLFVLIACFLAVFTEATSPSPTKKSVKPQFNPTKSLFPQISNYSRFLEEESQQKTELCEEAKHIFLSSHAQYSGFLDQNQTDYFKIVISPRDIKIIVSITNGMDNVDLFTSLDPENRFPNQETSTISTILTQTNYIELQEDDLNLLCERQFTSLCYLHIGATPVYNEYLNYSVLLERTQQGSPREKPTILLKDSQELHLPVPISGESPEIFYFYAMPYESSFVTLRYPGKKEVRVYANLLDKEMSRKTHTKISKHGGSDYFWQSEEDSEMGIVQLTISDLKKDDITLVELSVYFEEGEQYEESSGIYSILMTSGIMPIIENKQYHETIFADQYQYYSLDVAYSSSFAVCLETSDIENFTITIATPNQKELPTGPNPLFEVKSQNNTKILEVSTDIIGTWIIGINGPASKEFTMTMHYKNNYAVTPVANDNDFMVFENGITYSQHLAPAGLLKYLFYVNKLEEFILSINSTGANLKLYISDNLSDDPTDDLWSLDLVFNLDQQTQILSLPGYEFYNNSLSSEFAIRWNGNENVTLKQKPAYLIIENPTSSDIDFEILLASKERLWKTNTKYSISVPPQSTLPLILYPNGRIPGLTIEFIVNANEIPQDSILDIKYYFWFEDLRDSQQIFAKQIRHDPGFRIYPVHSLNNTYVVRKDFNFRPDNNRHLVLIRNPLETPIDTVQAMVSEYEHPNNELSISIRGPTSISHESLFLTPGVWSIWVFSCYKPFYSVEVSNEAQYSLFKSPSSSPELEHFYQIYITESGKYTISGVLPMLNIDVGDDYATRLETAFFPLETKTYKYTLKSQSLKIQGDVQKEANNTKHVSVKFEPLKIEDYDDSADSVLYTITVCTVNVTHCSRGGCSFSQSQYGKCRYECFVLQNKTGKLSDEEEIQISFAMSRSKGYDSTTGTNEYIDRYYYTVFADVMHYDKVVRSVAYQQEMIEFEPVGKEMMILIASLSILILIVGFIIYYWRKRSGRKNMRLHEIHPRANDVVRLQAAVDAQDNSEIQD